MKESFLVRSAKLVLALACFSPAIPVRCASNVYLLNVPDYNWWTGCFGTASGNLMGFWDRNGFPDLYTGPTAGGVAPLDSDGANVGIRSMWATKSGFDGRPADQPGHVDDYYNGGDPDASYEDVLPDPYILAGRAEHPADCIGDFIGLSQSKWVNMNGECDGNIDAFSFVYWDATGQKRSNFDPTPDAGLPATDIPSGLRAWTKYRGYSAEVFSQLADFNPNVPNGKGFTFEDLQREIDAGYPVLVFLQKTNEFSRIVKGVSHKNPHIHGMLAYGYIVTLSGSRYVRYRTSWASGDNVVSPWSSDMWQAELPVRGFIGFHPLPQISRVSYQGGNLTINWDGPASVLMDAYSQLQTPVQYYVVEKTTSLSAPFYETVSPPTTDHTITITNCCEASTYFRVKLVPAGTGEP